VREPGQIIADKEAKKTANSRCKKPNKRNPKKAHSRANVVRS